MHLAGLCLLAIAAAGTPAAQPGLAVLDADTRALPLREQLELLRDEGGELRFEQLDSDAVVFRPAEAGADTVAKGSMGSWALTVVIVLAAIAIFLYRNR